MTPELVYFLKINIAFAVFYLLYRILFEKDTFFCLRRIILIGFFGIAFLYPLFNIQEWITQQEPISEVIAVYSARLPEFIVQTKGPAISEKHPEKIIFIGLYLVGAFSLFIRFLIQIGSIIHLTYQSKKKTINGITIYISPRTCTPFSFFHLIFISAEKYSEKEFEEILTHELAHVKQWHSLDVILSELIYMTCWINPFVWLLKREVRYNLEYLADNQVLSHGYDPKSYQYHLLGLSCNYSGNTLYNSFNIIHLKNRIKMMNKERTKSFKIAKYLLLIPIIGLLLLISNIESMSRFKQKLGFSPQTDNQLVEVAGTVFNMHDNPIIGADIAQKDGDIATTSDLNGNFSLSIPENATLRISSPGSVSTEVLVNEVKEKKNLHIQLEPSGIQSIKFTDKKGREVFTIVDQMPSFPNGEDALLRFISQNIKYPKESIENGSQGRVICSFIVDEKGKIEDIQIVRGIEPLLDQESIRVLASMPDWTPGKIKGKNVPVKYTVPITFRIQ